MSPRLVSTSTMYCPFWRVFTEIESVMEAVYDIKITVPDKSKI